MNHVRFALCLAAVCLSGAGCSRKPDAAAMLAKMKEQGVRCVFIENHTKRPVTFQVSINSADPEQIALQPDHGLFLYEPLAEKTELSAKVPTHISISGTDGSMSGEVFSGDLQAVNNLVTGGVTASGWVSPDSAYGEPQPDWLVEHHLEARVVHDLRRVEAKISPDKP